MLNPVREYPALCEIQGSTIRAHHAKAGFDYPTIRLPASFSNLIGLPTRIYQTLYNGTTAFLVVVNPETVALTWRRSPVRIRQSPLSLFQIGHAAAVCLAFVGREIVAKKAP